MLARRKMMVRWTPGIWVWCWDGEPVGLGAGGNVERQNHKHPKSGTWSDKPGKNSGLVTSVPVAFQQLQFKVPQPVGLLGELEWSTHTHTHTDTNMRYTTTWQDIQTGFTVTKLWLFTSWFRSSVARFTTRKTIENETYVRKFGSLWAHLCSQHCRDCG